MKRTEIKKYLIMETQQEDLGKKRFCCSFQI